MPSDHSQIATKYYATLRGALRALSPAPEVLGSLDIESRFREIRSWIQQEADSEHDETQTRAKIDSSLTEINTEMLAIIDRLSFWQFRATLPAVRVDSPGDLESLLQVCLAGPDRRWSDLVDYLVTLLATRETEGRKQIERDPISVSTVLQEICADVAQEATDESLALAKTIGEASEALACGEPVGEIVQRVRELKRASENLLLIPDVLRSVVLFNVAVSNRMLQQQEVRRSLHQAELDVISESDSVARTDESGSNALPAFGSFELEAVESALQIRLAGGPAIDNPAHAVAEKVELSKLSAVEKKAFRDRSGDRVSRIVRTVVTIGLVVRHIDLVSDDLDQLGIDGEWLDRSSAGEIDKLAQAGIRELTRGCNFDQAQQLAELRARYLNPLFDEDLLIRPPGAVGANVTPPATDPSAGGARGASPVKRPRPAERTRPAAQRPKRRKSQKKSKRGGGSGVTGIAAGIVFALVAGAVLMSTRGDVPSNATQYTNLELAQITPYLTRGYTTTRDSVTIFKGTVNTLWTRIPRDLKQHEALEIGALMEKQGVSVVMFYDHERKLEFHYVGGRIRHLE